jgi:hypothetical protein
MTDEDRLEKQHRDGFEAARELKQTEEAFKALREGYVQAWQNSDPRDTAGREKIWVAMTILSKVEGQLRTTVTNGRVAQAEIEALRRAGEPKKRFGII